METATNLVFLTQQQKEKELNEYETKSQGILGLASLESLYYPVQAAEEQNRKAHLLCLSYREEMSVMEGEITQLKHCLKIRNLLMDNTKLLSKMLQTKVLIASSVA